MPEITLDATSYTLFPIGLVVLHYKRITKRPRTWDKHVMKGDEAEDQEGLHGI